MTTGKNSRTGRALGLGLTLALAIGCASAAYCDPAAPPAAAPNCALGLAAALPMTTEPNGTVAVPVKLADHDLLFEIDTGSIFSSIKYQSAWFLRLKQFPIESAKFSFIANVKVTNYTILPDFSLGQLHIASRPFLLDPNALLSPDSDGLLGPDILSNFDVDLDFAGGTLKLISPDHCPGQVVYWTKGGYSQIPMQVDGFRQISVPVDLDGKSVTAILDTGSYRSIMSAGMAKSVFGIDDKNPAAKSLGSLAINGTGGLAAFRYPFSKLTFGGVTVNNPDLMVLPDEAVGGANSPLLVGISILRQLHLYIAYKEQTLYVTPAQPDEPHAPSSGRAGAL